MFFVLEYAKYFWLLLVFSSLLLGCSESRTATVHGSVKVDSAVLNAGWVVFRNESNTLQGVIQSGGLYALSHRGSANLPCGEYGVVLVPPEPKNEVDPSTGAVRPGIIPDERLYPLRCRTMEWSGVRYTLDPGDQVIDLNFNADP